MSASVLAPPSPGVGPVLVDQYHRMIEEGIFTKDTPVELVEGWIVPQMPNSPRHFTTAQVIAKAIAAVLPNNWCIRVQGPITTDDSEPEPDVCVARGCERDYLDHHPGPKEIALLVEVSYSSLGYDRNRKARAYARAGISIYWIANIDERTIELMSHPDSNETEPRYRQPRVYSKSESIPLELGGQIIAQIPVADLLP